MSLDALGINGKRVTLVVPDDDIVTYLSFRNLPKVSIQQARQSYSHVPRTSVSTWQAPMV